MHLHEEARRSYKMDSAPESPSVEVGITNSFPHSILSGEDMR